MAGCQPLPHPFQPDSKQVSANDLRSLVANSLFLVEPLQNVPDSLGAAFAEALATELQRQEVPATARRLDTGRPSPAIVAVVTAQPAAGTTGPLQIDYALVEVDGSSRPVTSDGLAVTADAFASGDPVLVADLAERGARRLMDNLFRPRRAGPPKPKAPEKPAARFFIFDVSGAPGDGNAALARAMKQILTASGVPFAPEMTSDAYVLAGAVAMSPAAAAQEKVSIDWSLLAPDGETIGTVTVENLVPAGSLDGQWGPVANAASAGSAEGMIQLINAVLQSLPAETEGL